MTLDLAKLTELDETKVAENLDVLSGIIDSLDVGIDTSRGVFRDLVLRFHAILKTATDDAITKVLNSVVPSLAVANQSAIDEDIIGQVAANYGVTRRAASQSAGAVTITVSSQATFTIPRGSVFVTDNGAQYATQTVYTLKSTRSTITQASERYLAPRGDGMYEATIELLSVDAAASANVLLGQVFTPSSIIIPNLVSVVANSNFYGGADEESTDELLVRLRQTSVAKTMSSRSSIASFLSQPSALPDMYAVSVIGTGDLEMQRDKRTIFPGGNKVDVYVRTAATPIAKTHQGPAIVTEVVTGGEATWLTIVGRDVFPGFYRISDTVWADTSIEAPITAQTLVFGRDLTPIYGQNVPQTYYDMETAFSRFQTGIFTFKTPSLGLTVGDERDVTLTIEGMPNISELQDMAADRSFRFATGDTLIRAAMPCFVNVVARVNMRIGTDFADTGVIQNAVANYINTLGFAGELYASAIGTKIQDYLPPGSYVSSVDLVGEYILPTGEVIRTRTNEMLSAIHDYDKSVSNRTTIFIANSSSIHVALYEQRIPKVI